MHFLNQKKKCQDYCFPQGMNVASCKLACLMMMYSIDSGLHKHV